MEFGVWETKIGTLLIHDRRSWVQEGSKELSCCGRLAEVASREKARRADSLPYSESKDPRMSTRVTCSKKSDSLGLEWGAHGRRMGKHTGWWVE